MHTFTGTPGEQEQRIHTPTTILDAVADLWPEGIALDPAGSPHGIVKADWIVSPPDNGLAVEWPARTFVNPPYGDRLGERKQLYGLYGAIGKVLGERFTGW